MFLYQKLFIKQQKNLILIFNNSKLLDLTYKELFNLAPDFLSSFPPFYQLLIILFRHSSIHSTNIKCLLLIYSNQDSDVFQALYQLYSAERNKTTLPLGAYSRWKMDNKQMKTVLRAIREGAGCQDVDYWGSCKGGTLYL